MTAHELPPELRDEPVDREAEKRVYQAQLRVVSDRVEAWIEFHRRRNDLDVRGYPTQTTVERMAHELAAAERVGKAVRRGQICKKAWACLIHPTYSGRDWDYEMETDVAIRAMPGSLRRFLKMNYLEAGTQEMKAQRLQVSLSTYKSRVDLALHFLVTWGLSRNWFKKDLR